ncbi:hypothetical protein P692DRAFT_201668714, partial [Suillus brevipes Sb2]
GPSLPRRDRTAVYPQYCHLMLILFKPWCAIQHLKNVHDSWIDAFEMFVDQCGVRLRKIMDNMQLLHECKDSRDD